MNLRERYSGVPHPYKIISQNLGEINATDQDENTSSGICRGSCPFIEIAFTTSANARADCLLAIIQVFKLPKIFVSKVRKQFGIIISSECHDPHLIKKTKAEPRHSPRAIRPGTPS